MDEVRCEIEYCFLRLRRVADFTIEESLIYPLNFRLLPLSYLKVNPVTNTSNGFKPIGRVYGR